MKLDVHLRLVTVVFQNCGGRSLPCAGTGMADKHPPATNQVHRPRWQQLEGVEIFLFPFVFRLMRRNKTVSRKAPVNRGKQTWNSGNSLGGPKKSEESFNLEEEKAYCLLKAKKGAGRLACNIRGWPVIGWRVVGGNPSLITPTTHGSHRGGPSAPSIAWPKPEGPFLQFCKAKRKDFWLK